MSTDLRPFSFLILTLVGRGGASAHDIVLMMRRGRAYWSAAESHYYSEPKRLARLGYLEADSAPGKTTSKRVYTLTKRGERALSNWLTEPTSFPRIQSEAIVRVLAAEYADPASVRASLLAMRDELDEIDGQLDVNLAMARELPHRAQSIRLVTELGRRVIDAHRDWLDSVEVAFGADDGSDDAPPARESSDA